MESPISDHRFSEVLLDIDALFFSITDKTSKILSGNDYFVRISEYAKPELIGKYHNVIRHPEMPKSVFRIFWEHLESGHPVVAYVKNKAKSGRFYWVLAAAFPMNDVYISIRIKPTGRLFSTVKELYRKVLYAELSDGVEGGMEYFGTWLRENGYESYDALMSDILVQEVQSRQSLLSDGFAHTLGERCSLLPGKVAQTFSDASALMSLYVRWFERIGKLIDSKHEFETKSRSLRQIARETVFLSLNASVSSYKVEEGGETFGILARDIRTNAKENDHLISLVDEEIHNLALALNDLVLYVAGMQMQTEAFVYFLSEVTSLECKPEDKRDNLYNLEHLIELQVMTSQTTSALQKKVQEHLTTSFKRLEQLEQQVMYLGYVQIYGIIEAASNPQEKVNFTEIFSQLKKHVDMTASEVEEMQKGMLELSRVGQNLFTESTRSDTLLENLTLTLEALKGEL